MIDLWNNVDFFCDFQQILTFLTSQFLTLCTSIRKKSAKYILSCYLGYKIVDNLKKKFLIWRGYPQCALPMQFEAFLDANKP